MALQSVVCICMILLISICIVECGTIRQKQTQTRPFSRESPKKRPFCNAFTGCGRKRSSQSNLNGDRDSDDQQLQQQHQQQQQQNGLDDDFIEDSLGDLLDLNSEPAVEDLMRQIMSQAKLWEAIQEANREITIMKNDRNGVSRKQFPTVAFNAQ